MSKRAQDVELRPRQSLKRVQRIEHHRPSRDRIPVVHAKRLDGAEVLLRATHHPNGRPTDRTPHAIRSSSSRDASSSSSRPSITGS